MNTILFVYRVRLYLVLVTLIALPGKIVPCSAEMIDCPRFLPPKNQEWYKPGEIKTLQETLNEIGYRPIRTDGILGDETITALRHYCIPRSYQITLNDMEDPDKLLEEKNKSKQVKSGKNQFETVDEPVFSDSIKNKLEILIGNDYATVDLFDNAIETIAKITPKELNSPKKNRENVHLLAEKEHPLDQPTDVLWESDGCGCAPHFSSVVYGFYPYWIRDETADKGEKADSSPEKIIINYSALSRIGFYAVFMGPSGEYRTPVLWEKHKTRFIKKAKRYRVKVDLVIHNSDWMSAARINRPEIIKAIVKLAKEASRCDGVTLYFERFPEIKDDLKPLRNFLKELRSTVRNIKPSFSVNLMLPAGKFDEIDTSRDHSGKRYEKGENLIHFLSIFESENDNFVDLLILFLKEPTSITKKEMRYRIEKKFSGRLRRNVFRKVVPVIAPPLDPGAQQFEDDLIYFEDNFFGIAFWPMPIGGGKRIEEMKKRILNNYIINKDQKFRE
ncbi:MAG: peptidoglycan-binding domain-containing protein, partial [Desulfobacteraceae bacterium]